MEIKGLLAVAGRLDYECSKIEDAVRFARNHERVFKMLQSFAELNNWSKKYTTVFLSGLTHEADDWKLQVAMYYPDILVEE